MTIKDSLLKGVTPEKLIEDLKAEIAAAQKEIDKSKENKELADAREGMVYSIVFYLEKLGLLTENDWDEWDIEEWCKIIAKAEIDTKKDMQQLIAIKNLLGGAAGMKPIKPTPNKSISDEDMDKMIKKFCRLL